MCPRVKMDDRQVEHEESPPGKPTRRRGRYQPPQFTLGGVLAFFTAITVCISLAATGARVMEIAFDLGLVLYGVTALVTWIVLSVTYGKLRLRTAMVFHWVGLGLITGLGVVAVGTESAPVTLGWLVLTYFGVVCWGCAVGSALSVPVFLVTMVVRLARGATGGPRSPSQLDAGSEQPPQLIDEPRDHRFGVRGEDGEP